ncbi:MAG: flagellar basal body L-ring protein FlgH [Bacteroidota bacterium]
MPLALAQDAAVEPEASPTRAVSIFADVRAHNAGDLLTVILAERTSARRLSQSSADERASIRAGGDASLGEFFGFDAGAEGSRESDSRTVQSDLLTGTITARVTAVDGAGNLSIEGERRLNVDGAVHLMRVRGLVRPADVTTANTVFSHQIASADVEYRQEGGGPTFLRGRFLAIVGTAAVLVGALLLRSSTGGGGDVAAELPVDLPTE